MGPFYEIDGLRPVVAGSAYVHPRAAVIGDVHIGADVYVGPQASLRGDFGRIVLGRGSNVQDCCVMHAFPEMMVEVDEDGHIGHSAVLHGCAVGAGAMVGIGAVVLDGAALGEASIVGAKSLVKAGFRLPPRHLAVGAPARVVRELTEEEIAWKAEGTRAYQRLVGRSAEGLRPCKPLVEAEPGRRTIGELRPEELGVAPKQ